MFGPIGELFSGVPFEDRGHDWATLRERRLANVIIRPPLGSRLGCESLPSLSDGLVDGKRFGYAAINVSVKWQGKVPPYPNVANRLPLLYARRPRSNTHTATPTYATTPPAMAIAVHAVGTRINSAGKYPTKPAGITV